jgi:GMP reductase
MDTTGTFEMGVSLAKYKCLTTIHKYYSPEDWKIFSIRKPEALPFVAISAGTSSKDFEIVKRVTGETPDLQMICLDVANGYSQYFVETVHKFRKAFPKHVILAGNVVTGDQT